MNKRLNTRKSPGGKLDPEMEKVAMAAYQRGLIEGKNRHKAMIEQMAITNGHLFEMLSEINGSPEPLEGVLLSFELVDQIIAALKRPTRSCKLAKLLHKLQTQSVRTFRALLQQAEGELMGIIDEEQRSTID
ncbi:MAG: hypothetical protein JXM79_00405 [Sedimentisphaerales bacterium]|nr:hypothetical protein [Sedimentisphaerales bacterium]